VHLFSGPGKRAVGGPMRRNFGEPEQYGQATKKTLTSIKAQLKAAANAPLPFNAPQPVHQSQRDHLDKR
jgi:hypothetical protein